MTKQDNLLGSGFIYKSLFDNIPVGFYRTTVGGQITEANSWLFKMLGYPDKATLLRANVSEIFVEPITRIKQQKNLNQQEILQGYEIQLRCQDGSIIWAEDYARGIKNKYGIIEHYEGILIDIRERKQLEVEILKAEKNQLMNQLLSGISHDFNNLLTIISGNTALLEQRLNNEPSMAKPISRILNASQKMSHLLEQINALSSSVKDSENSTLIQQTIPAMITTFFQNHNVRFELDLPASLSPVKGSGIKINEIIQNLISNAIEAMPDGGVVKIKAKVVLLNRDQLLQCSSRKCVRMIIEDQGTGIPHHNLSKIFLPYFSTKSMVTEKGLGLGLTLSFNNIKSLGGDLEIESQEGTGTTATVYFPLF